MTQSTNAKSPSSRSRFSRVSLIAALIAGVLVSLAAYRYLLGGPGGHHHHQLSSLSDTYKVVLARFFRDLSRYKARRRLFSNSDTSLIHIVLGKDKAEEIKLTSVPRETEEFSMTAQQLAEMNGLAGETPIYVSILDRIYDVSAGRFMYGPGRNYYGLVGKDATYCYGTANFNADCDKGGSRSDLTEIQLADAYKWVEFYHNHDKYKYVGRLMADPVDRAVEDALRSPDQGGDE